MQLSELKAKWDALQPRTRTSILVGGVAIVALLAGHCTANAAPKDMRICTGGESGNYFFAGSHIAAQAKGSVNVDVVSTRGSMDNLERIEKGECNAGIVQSDAFLAYQRAYPKSTLKLERSGVLYNELVHLICNRSAKVGKITKLTPQNVVAVGRNGSGSAVTWDGFISVDQKRYKPVQTVPLDGERALAKVADGTEVQCMLFTAGLNTPFVKDTVTAYKDRVELVPTDDRDIKDAKDPKGNPLYSYDAIPSGMYPVNGGLFNGVDTISVKALLVVSSDWADQNDREYNKFLEAVRKALPAIKQRVGQ